MTMCKALHRRHGINRLYVPRMGRIHTSTETESLFIAAQNNAIRTNHIKAKIDKTQQNSKCGLCGDRDETIYHIICKCIKLTQRVDKTKHV